MQMLGSVRIIYFPSLQHSPLCNRTPELSCAERMHTTLTEGKIDERNSIEASRSNDLLRAVSNGRHLLLTYGLLGLYGFPSTSMVCSRSLPRLFNFQPSAVLTQVSC
jgi:hypothetical protein